MKREVKRRVWIDVLLVTIAMLVSVSIRLPAVFMPKVLDGREQYYSADGTPYLKEMDSYHFVKKMNIIAGNEDGNLTKFDNILPILGVMVYKIGNVFSHVSTEQVAAFLGPFIFMFACIPAYIFVKRKTNRAGGFLSALLIGITPSLVIANGFMTFDTDILLAVLPLLLALFFVLALEEETKKKRIIYTVSAVLTFVILCLSWHSASVYFYLFLIVSICLLVFFLLKDKAKIKIKTLLVLMSCMAICFIGLELMGFVSDNLRIFQISESSLYPDSGLFVIELQKLPLVAFTKLTDLFLVQRNGNINFLGGIGLLLVAISAVAFFLFIIFAKGNSKRENLNKIFNRYKSLSIVGILLVVWFLGAMISLPRGIRFTKIAALPICLLAGVFFGILIENIKDKKGWMRFFILGIIAIFPSFGAVSSAIAFEPSANKSLEETANYIREELGEEYRIATWWDLGYFYEYKGVDVLFDGGTQGGGYLYWVANALTTDDPELTKGIFRMLSVDYLELKAPEKATEMFDGDLAAAAKMIKEILVLKKDGAREKLAKDYDFSEDGIEELLALTHPENPQKTVVVVTQDMIKKLDTISYYGSYDLIEGKGSSEEVRNSMMTRLFNSDNAGSGFVLRKKINDPLNKFGSAVWIIDY